MSETHLPAQTTLPNSVMRPLLGGFVAIAGFIVLFLIWATQAPLTTSIHATGNLKTANPSFDIQHPFGGDIAEIAVREHDAVSAGQLLLRMDVTDALDQRGELQSTLTTLLEEKTVLQSTLSRDLMQIPADVFAAPSLPQTRIRNMQAVLKLRQEAGVTTEHSLRDQALGLQAGLQARKRQQVSMQARYERYSALVSNGALRAADGDVLLEAILELEAGIQSEQAELGALQSQATQVHIQTQQDLLDFRQRLLDRLAQIEDAIPKLRLQILRLDAEIKQADVRAPDSGTVSRLYYDTDQMFIPRGETVLTLTRHSQDHTVSFIVSPQAIDQIRVRMQGALTVTSLSQRNHPRVGVLIHSLSPEARRNQEGSVVGYDGIAVINETDMAALLANMGDDLSLSIDMPVNLIFSGRQVTFATYVVGPFMDFLSKALQD